MDFKNWYYVGSGSIKFTACTLITCMYTIINRFMKLVV